MGQRQGFAGVAKDIRSFGTFDQSSEPSGSKGEHVKKPDVAHLEANTDSIKSKVPSYVMLLVLLTGNFLAALDGTITTTLAVPLLKTFEKPSILSWLGSAYFIGCACVQPLCGRFCDRYSSKVGMLGALYLFAVGNMLVTISPCSFVVVVGRALSGVGGGAVGTIASIIVSELVSLDRRGPWQGVINIAFGLGHGLGGPLGGLLDAYLGWRFAFLVQVVATFGLIVLCIDMPSIRRMPKPSSCKPLQTTSELKPMDLQGAALITAGIASLLYSINFAVFSATRWLNPTSIVSAAVSAILISTYIYLALHKPETAILPLGALCRAPVLTACLTSALISAGFTGFEFFLPIFLQLQSGSVVVSGARLSALSVGGMLGSLTIGYLSVRWSRASILSLVVLAAASALMLTHDPMASWLLVDVTAGACAFGFAGSLTGLLVELLASSEPAEVSTNTSLNYAFRHIGAALGVAASASVFRIMLVKDLEAAFRGVDVPSMERALQALTTAGHWPHDVQERVRMAVGVSLRGTFSVSWMCCSLALGFYSVAYLAFDFQRRRSSEDDGTNWLGDDSASAEARDA